MRGGWVTQLCTFAYVVVWPEILYEVEYELEAEELRNLQEDANKSKKAKEQRQKERENEGHQQDSAEQEHTKGKEKEKENVQRHHDYQHEQQQRVNHEFTDREPRFSSPPASSVGASSYTPTTKGGNTLPLSASSSTLNQLAASTSSTLDGSGAFGTLSPPMGLSTHSIHTQTSPGDASSSSPFNNNIGTNKMSPLSEPPSASASPPTIQQTEGERFALAARLTRIADKQAQAAYERSAAFSRKPVPVPTSHPSLNTSAHLAHLSPYIIVDARRATGKDSLYLSAIGRRFTDPKVRAAWPVFWKYFNGRSALERVILGLGGDATDRDNGIGGEGGGAGGRGDNNHKLRIKKRKEAWALMTAMSEHLICVRHF
jgi:nitrogen permease regulator 3-like protein